MATGLADTYRKRHYPAGGSSSDSNITLVEAAQGKKIRLISLSLSASGAGTVTLKSDSTILGGNQFKTADPAWVLQPYERGWAVTGQSEKLLLSNPSALTINWILTYEII